MKKFTTIILFLYSFLGFSQFNFVEYKSPNNDWDIYPETNIKYSNGKEDIKQILCLQALLAENRLDEMFKMLTEFGYVGIPNFKNMYWKNQVDNKFDINEIQPILKISNIKGNNVYDNYLYVGFALTTDTNERIKFTASYKQVSRMYKIINQIFPVGNSYNALKDTWNENMILADDMTMNWTDRYTVEISDLKGNNVVYKASNFHKPSISFQKIDTYNTIVFKGPGKAYSTHLNLKRMSKSPDEKGQYPIPTMTFTSVITDMSNKFKPESREPFNILFFMSLENFNDRIWSDNKF